MTPIYPICSPALKHDNSIQCCSFPEELFILKINVNRNAGTTVLRPTRLCVMGTTPDSCQVGRGYESNLQFFFFPVFNLIILND